MYQFCKRAFAGAVLYSSKSVAFLYSHRHFCRIRLQSFFNEHIFSWEKKELEEEGVDVSHVEFTTNEPLLDMLLGRPIGIFALLDEESYFPKVFTCSQWLYEKRTDFLILLPGHTK